jgi:hypothetical protein
MNLGRLLCNLIRWVAVTYSAHVAAGYELEISNNLFYSDDASLFTVTRQLSLLDDPTQPAVDRPNGRSDFVYEPTAAIKWELPERFGKSSFFAKAGGYVFAANPEFTHASFQTALTHRFNNDMVVSAMYRFIPDRLLGNNLIEQEDSVSEIEGKESLTSHIWAIHVEQTLADWFDMHLLVRYGLRDYDEIFKHRSTNFWTVGGHFQIEIDEDTEIFLGYHFENGDANNQRAVEINDNVSYHTHYASIEIERKLNEKFKLVLDFDFEKNIYTTPNIKDEHFGSPEQIFLGGIELRYVLTETATITLGLEHGSRKRKLERYGFDNNNVMLGFEYTL